MRVRFPSPALRSFQGRSVRAPTWLGRTTVKCRRSSVATSVSPSRSAMAITDASVVPSGRLAYLTTRSTIRAVSRGQLYGREVTLGQRPQEQRLKPRAGFPGQAGIQPPRPPLPVPAVASRPRADHQTARHRLCGPSRWPAPLPPAALCHKRSRRTTETVLKQILRPGCHVIRPALPGSEPGRRPGPVLDGPKVTADIVEHCRDFLLGKLLDQPEQFLALHAHKPSVRSPDRLAPLLCGVPVTCPIGW